MPLLDILITKVIPIIIKTEIADKIANNSLNTSPICSKSTSILESAIGWQAPSK